MAGQVIAASSERTARVRARRLLMGFRGTVGIAMLATVLFVAIGGPLMAPFALDKPVGVPGQPPGGHAILGTDFLGRDVLSRMLYGGREVFGLSISAVALTYAIGCTLGMAAAVWGGRADSVLMRTVDLFISVPGILFLLVLVTGAGTSSWVLVVGTVAVSFPGVARISRTATLEVATAGYVEAAIARGERTAAVMLREILPNIAASLIADVGVRFVGVVYLIASLSFLGFGSPPPTANWGLMIAENRPVIGLNIFAVLSPAIMIALLTIAVNLLGEAYVASGRRNR